MTPEINRRKLLGAGGAALAAGLAGCSGVLGDGRGVPGTEGGVQNPPGGGGPDVDEDIPEAVHTYLMDNEANGYEGEMVDQTGEDSITIMVGAGTGFAFDPVLVNVDPGTEVTWEWTGAGGAHNVESTEAPEEFRSGDPVVEEGTTYSYTFNAEGNYRYHCSPHTSSGMHAAVIVGDPSGGGGDGGDGSGTETDGSGNETSGEE
jgi:halocyanin-like protein